ncbi:hypothetical protein ACFVFI_09690 [Streptomyces sp. NPDC057705]
MIAAVAVALAVAVAVAVDSTIVRAHQHAAGARRKGLRRLR